MSKKNEKDKGVEFSPAHIFGIVNVEEKKMIKVSLNETEIDLDMAFHDPNQFFKCEFTIIPKV